MIKKLLCFMVLFFVFFSFLGCDQLDGLLNPQYTLNIIYEGEGRVEPETGAKFASGEIAYLKVFPGEDYKFDRWQGTHGHQVKKHQNNEYILIMDSHKTINAIFVKETEYTLTIGKEGEGTLTPTVGQHNYAKNTVVNLVAVPESGWEFREWIGDVANRESAETLVTMDNDKTIKAIFGAEGAVQYTLTMEKVGAGVVEPPLGDHVYDENTVVNLVAVPESGWEFREWIGDVANRESAETLVTMDNDKTIKAIFVAQSIEPVEDYMGFGPNALWIYQFTMIYEGDIEEELSGLLIREVIHVEEEADGSTLYYYYLDYVFECWRSSFSGPLSQ